MLKDIIVSFRESDPRFAAVKFERVTGILFKQREHYELNIAIEDDPSYGQRINIDTGSKFVPLSSSSANITPKEFLQLWERLDHILRDRTKRWQYKQFKLNGPIQEPIEDDLTDYSERTSVTQRLPW